MPEPAKLRVATITADEPHHRYLISLLAANFDLAGSIMEPCARRRAKMFDGRRWSSWFWFTYHHWRRTITGLDRYRRNFFLPKIGSNPVPDPLVVDSVNDPQAIEAIRKWRADVVILCGTSILRQDMLEACGPNLINVHGGFLPYYRGNHCFFFAMLHGEYDKVGSSIHFVSSGIDTGDLIERAIMDIGTADTPESMYCRCEFEAFHLLVKLLEDYGKGIPFPRQPQPALGHEYRCKDRTLSSELHWIFRRLG